MSQQQKEKFSIFDVAFAAGQPTAVGKSREQILMEAEAVAKARAEAKPQTVEEEREFNVQVSEQLQKQPKITHPLMTGEDIVKTAFKSGGVGAAVAIGGGLKLEEYYLAKPETIASEAAAFKSAQVEREVSTKFYSDIGFPQFGGKYGTFDIPAGYKVEKVKEEAGGLEIAFSKVESKGISEQLKGFTVEPFFQVPSSPEDYWRVQHGQKITRQPLQGLAGIVAVPESFAYSVGRLAGFETPRIPATVSSGLISSIVGSVTTGKLTASEELMESLKSPEYALGTIFGDVAASYIVGKGVQKLIIEPISKTQAGQYIGYQFKTHAPKSFLRVVYGKSGAEYIVSERARLPAEEFKDLFATTGAAKESFPLIQTKGQAITPMKTTLSKLIGDTKGTAQILQPLGKIAYPEIPIGVQFGVTPFSDTMFLLFGAGAVGFAQATRTETLMKQVVKPSVSFIGGTKLESITGLKLESITGMKLESKLSSMVVPMAGLKLFEAQVPMSLQITRQAQAQVQQQRLIQKQTLKLKLETPTELMGFPKFMKRRKGKMFKRPWSKYLWDYPIMSPSQLLFGTKKGRRRKK